MEAISMKKIACIILSLVMVLSFTACSTRSGTTQEQDIIIKECEAYFNNYPKSSALMVQYAPFTKSSLAYTQKLLYACVRTGEEYSLSGNKKQKKLLESNKVRKTDVKELMEELYNTDLEEITGTYVNDSGDGNITFTTPNIDFTPVFSLTDISFLDNFCIAEFKVSKISTAGKSSYATLILNFSWVIQSGEITSIQIKSAKISQ
jgi:hypothetical protein